MVTAAGTPSMTGTPEGLPQRDEEIRQARAAEDDRLGGVLVDRAPGLGGEQVQQVPGPVLDVGDGDVHGAHRAAMLEAQRPHHPLRLLASSGGAS